MQNKLKTALVLLFAGITTLVTHAAPLTATEQTWVALTQSKSAEPEPTAAALADPAALTLRDSILAADVIGKMDLSVLLAIVYARTEGSAVAKKAAVDAAATAIATSNKTGEGKFTAQALLKQWSNDPEGWSDQMVQTEPEIAASVALNVNSSPGFRTSVWNVIKNRKAVANAAFFKAYRGTLPKAEQIAVTQTQKDIMLAIPQRNAADNAWLAEISADLVALQLDQ